MLILVCGSRTWTDDLLVEEVLAEYLDQDPTIMHGRAPRGADMIADAIARYLGYEVRRFKADWKKYGKAAGMIRNSEMIDENPDLVIAFQRRNSSGTQDTIDKARKRGIPVRVESWE